MRNVLGAFYYPEFTEPYPYFVNHDPVIQVHCFKENDRLNKRGFKVGNIAPYPDKYYGENRNAYKDLSQKQ